MKTIRVEDLAYYIKTARNGNQPMPIFFLGAGASKTGGIPLAGEIVKDILDQHEGNPAVRKLKENKQTYPRLMGCLSPYQRNQLLKEYIDQAKINVTHLYLAQLFHNGFVDYVLTVNFDNLMLRALALYNEFPPTYDMAVLKELTTTTFHEKSVVYLHGQHHGLWLLNTEDEMAKVEDTVPPILNKIVDRRPWVFIGYSGTDPIFDHIRNLGRFDNGLYWVAYRDRNPVEQVVDFLNNPNTNSYLIKDYDADAFMMKLNQELELPQPTLIDKPFTSLQLTLNELVDIDEEIQYKGVKSRLASVHRQVNQAINKFEKNLPDVINEEDNQIELAIQEISDWIVEERYPEDRIKEFEEKAATSHNIRLMEALGDLYFNWAFKVSIKSETMIDAESDKILRSALEKWEKASVYRPNDDKIYNNWGTDLYVLACLKSGEESEKLFQESLEKLGLAVKLNSSNSSAFNNWGNSLGSLASRKSGRESEMLFKKSFEKYRCAISINPENSKAYHNWGIDLAKFASQKSGDEFESLHRESIEKFRNAIEINPNYSSALYNLGNSLGHLASRKSGRESELLYNESFEIYRRAISINPNDSKAYNNWGINLLELSKTQSEKQRTKTIEEAEELLKRGVELGSGVYNLACLYALSDRTAKAIKYLEICLLNSEVDIDHVNQDTDWDGLRDNPDFQAVLEKFQKA